MPDNDAVLDPVMRFSEVVVEAANRVAADSGLTLEQSIAVVQTSVMMLLNGTLYGGLAAK